ncbi:MAG: DUF2341 domain-containing protein, partial [Proteobacteria bacterium]|nr:DUF2341 domain-containing protein [Pseudomonadota bacterium]
MSALLCLLTIQLASASPWDDEDWEYRVELVIDNQSIGDDLEDFPVLVTLDSIWFDYSEALEDGDDLRFFDESGRALPYEIDSWDPTYLSQIWVKAEEITANQQEIIYLYFGNPAAAPASDGTSTFSDEFQFVMHGDSSHENVTNGLVATASGVSDTDGVIGDGLQFNGSGYLSLTENLLTIVSLDTTASFWINTDVSANTFAGYPAIFGNADLATGDDVLWGTFDEDGHIGLFAPYLGIMVTLEGDQVWSTTAIDDQEWHWITLTRDYLGDTSVWVDGVLESTDSIGPVGSATMDTIGKYDVIIMSMFNETYYFDGSLDEFRLSNTVHSDGWLQAEYQTMTGDYVEPRCMSKLQYPDVDADGYGAFAPYFYGCAQWRGSSLLNTDCDDDNGSINPGVDEVCDSTNVDEDCDGLADDKDPEGATGKTKWYFDSDLDGSGDPNDNTRTCDMPGGYVDNSDDCDDGDIDVHPLADEYCNNIDDDCDGMVDNNAVDPLPYFTDGDDDGFGTSSVVGEACSPPLGMSFNDQDCNDADEDINPSASEICGDGLDNDCDESIDEDGTKLEWFEDGDDDGFGSSLSSKTKCKQPNGWVLLDDDCDDTDETIFPEASETCGDGVDSDCDGQGGPEDDEDADGLTFLEEEAVGSSDCAVDSDGDGFVEIEPTEVRV